MRRFAWDRLLVVTIVGLLATVGLYWFGHIQWVASFMGIDFEYLQLFDYWTIGLMNLLTSILAFGVVLLAGMIIYQLFNYFFPQD